MSIYEYLASHILIKDEHCEMWSKIIILYIWSLEWPRPFFENLHYINICKVMTYEWNIEVDVRLIATFHSINLTTCIKWAIRDLPEGWAAVLRALTLCDINCRHKTSYFCSLWSCMEMTLMMTIHHLLYSFSAGRDWYCLEKLSGKDIYSQTDTVEQYFYWFYNNKMYLVEYALRLLNCNAILYAGFMYK